MPQTATPLVAVDDHDEVVGVCLSSAPGSLLATLEAAGVDKQTGAGALLAVVKVAALAVMPEHRHRRLGRGLVQQTARLFHGLGAFVVYGQARVGDNLTGFYQRAGSEMLAAGAPLDLRFIADGIGGLCPLPGEQSSFQNNPDPSVRATSSLTVRSRVWFLRSCDARPWDAFNIENAVSAGVSDGSTWTWA